MDVMTNNSLLLKTALEFIVVLVAYLLGRFVYPKISSNDIEMVEHKVNLIITFADKFVSYAKQFMNNKTGAEKMDEVVSMLVNVATKYHINLTQNEIKAIAQKAYDNMKASEVS